MSAFSPRMAALRWRRGAASRRWWGPTRGPSQSRVGEHGTVVLDIANIGVARGKVYAARQRGERLPEGWALDVSGLPTTDPQAAIDGLILPMAGHKGYAISFMMDVLSGVLTGSSFGSDVVGPYVPDQRSGCGHLVIAINIAAIMPPEQFSERIDQLITSLKLANCSRPRDPGTWRIGKPLCHNGAGTVTVPAKTVEELNGLAEAVESQPSHRSGDVTLFVTLDVHEDKLDEFVDAITVNAAASLRDELGCLAFDVHQDIAVPLVYLYEIYVDEDAFRIAHRSAPHYTRWQAAAKRCVVEGSHTNTFARPIRLGPRNAA